MAINDLPSSTNDTKPSLILSLRPKKSSSNSTMDKNKFQNSDDILTRMDRLNTASSSNNMPLSEHPNNMSALSRNSQMNSNKNVHRTNCNISLDDPSFLILNGTEDNNLTQNASANTEKGACKEEVDLIELLGRDWPVQAGDSLTNILNSDYNYNKDIISKQDLKKYDSNHRLKHTYNRHSANSERNKSMNPVSHLLNDRKPATEHSQKELNSKIFHTTTNNHSKVNVGLPKFNSDLPQGLEAAIRSPTGLDDYLPGPSVSNTYHNIDTCIRLETVTNIEGSDFGVGSMVQVTTDVSEPLYGVLRWLGRNTANSKSIIAGVELEEDHMHLPLTLTDGTYYGKRFFDCPTNRALFVPLEQCHHDERFLDQRHEQPTQSRSYHDVVEANETRIFGNVECPAVPGSIPPLSKTSDLESVCGKFRGIQGHHNSCYLDATLFSMFTFTGVFDSLLFRPRSYQDSNHYEEVQKVLREEIVNPLRKNLFVRADKVMKLRTLLEKLSSVTGLTCEEKDPEEFLNCLLSQILHADPFLKLSSGQEAFYYQLFVEKDERLLLPSVQQLFEQSFLASDIKLKQVPSCLIIQMPRFGKSFKMYPRILPSQLLDVTDIIDDSPRQCTVCGKLAEFECRDCFGQCGMGLESTAFCGPCLETVHSHAKRANHKAKHLSVPIDFSIMAEHCPVPRLYMELFAVVCIETSHYVTFVKAGSGHDVPWCFFDSMADRKGEQNGYNIPEMVSVPDLPQWLSDDGARMLHEQYPNDKQLPEHAKRLMCDAYMCMYQSPDVMMYR